MAKDYPQITFVVNNINLQELFRSPPVDGNYDNALNLLKQTTFWVLYVPYELRHGDCFTLYGPRALEIKKIYIDDIPETLRKLEISYYGAPTDDCLCNCTIQIDPPALPPQQVGTPFSATITATGGKAPYTYTIDSGILPPGLSLSASGTITGTPTSSGSYEFVVKVTDGSSTSAMTYRIKVKPLLVFSPLVLPNTTQSVAYNQTISTSGGLAPYTYSITAGSLPTGLSLNTATGAITGTPTAAGAYNFTILSSDGNSDTGSRSYAITINNPVVVSPASLPPTTEGEVYSQTVSSTGGTGAITFSVSAGSLPTGLSLNATTGVISGTVTVAGTYNFTITGTDTVGATGNKAYSVVINPPVAVTPATLPNTTITIAYSQTVTATGGTGTKTYAVTFGSLPTGLSLDVNTGVISGTPITAGSYNFAVTATDTVGATGNTIYTVVINSPVSVSPATLPDTTINIAYSQTVTASNGTGAKTFSVTSGTLPTGLSLNGASGVISGTPTVAAASTFTITATDTVTATGSQSYTVTINPAITLAPATLPSTTQGVVYSQSVTASNGTGAKTYTVTSGSLPTGLSLNASTGGISGTTTAAATYNFTITATDTVGATASQAYTVVVAVPLSISPATLPDTTINTAYSQTITGTGGTAPITYSVSSGTLPTGLSLNTSTGVISGTPTVAAASSFTITATDANGATASQAYSVTINAAIAVSPATLPDTTINVAYSQTVSASNGTGVKTFAVTSGTLPTGLSLDANTGVISGTPTVAAASTFTITATDTVTATGSQAYTVTINPAITLAPATLPTTTQGVAYSQVVTASNGTGAKTYSVTSGSLPTGLSLTAATGAITGTPTTAATYNFTITATDTVTATGSQAYTILVNAPLSVSPATLPDTTINTAYSQTVSATGGTAPIAYSISAGSLPTGLSLNTSTGVISGTPTATGASNFTITATDANGATASQAYTVTINAAIAVSPATLPDTTINTAYSQTISATGGTGAKTFSVTSGTLPTGLSLDANTGVISGTPTAAAASSFTVTATDTVTATGSQAYSVTINAAIAVSPASLPNTTQGVAYSQTVSATGGTGAKTFSVTVGSLPTGLSLDANTGVISGTSSSAATYNFTITATDTVTATGSQAYSVVVSSGLSISPATLPDTTINTAYSQTVTATGGTAPIAYSVSSGTLPTGLSLNTSTGVISGTPTVAATSSFTITATDASSATANKAYSVTINPAIAVSPASLPNTTNGVAYSQTVSATGGTGAKTFSVTVGSLPTGLSLDANTGVISGTPTTNGASSFTITATDTVTATGSQAYTVTINAAMVVSPSTLPNTTINTAYSQTVSATGGTGAKTFAVTSGSLPTGLSLDANTGVISGTPTSAATSNFTITATDSVSATASQAYTVVINPAISVSPASLPNPQVGTAYNQTVSATGGTGAKTFSVTVGSLPAGLSLDANTGVISGTPTSSGSVSFTITATDTVSATGSQAYTVTVSPASVISISPSTLPNTTINIAYSETLTASGGTSPYTYSVTSGSLPTGLSLDVNSGVISGTPTATGTSNFTVTATDALSITGNQSYTVVINAAIAVSPASLPDTTINTAYSETVSATGGTGTKTFSVTVGSLPTGLSLDNNSGVVSGTPTATGTSNFTITATDTVTATGSKAYTVVINAAIVVSPASLPDPTNGTAYSQTVSATGGTGTKTFSVTVGSLPTGLSLDSNSGVISGTPTGTGAASFTITATDTVNATGNKAYSVTVQAAATTTTTTAAPATTSSTTTTTATPTTTSTTTTTTATPTTTSTTTTTTATPTTTSTTTTTSSTTTTTATPSCIVVNTGNTSDMTHSSITDGISYSNNSVVGTTTTTTTAAPSNTLTGGTTCANRVSWPAYGVGNKYQVTWSAAATPQFFQSDSTSRTFYIDNPSTTVTRKGYNGTCNQMGFNNITAGNGVNGLATNPTFFSIEIPSGGTFPITLDVWIV